MAVQPIDLQTLFTQIEQVGKTQSAQREGLQIQAGLQGLEAQRKAEERVRAVNEAQNTGDGAQGVRERRSGDGGGEGGRRERGEGEEAPSGDAAPRAGAGRIIRDPALGKNIDFSG